MSKLGISGLSAAGLIMAGPGVTGLGMAGPIMTRLRMVKLGTPA